MDIRGTAALSAPVLSIDGLDFVHLADEDQPRIKDTDLAIWLEMKQPRNIRQKIEVNKEELNDYDEVLMRTQYVRIKKSGSHGKDRGFEERQVDYYWLTRDQALVIVQLSRGEKAKRMRRLLIELFKRACRELQCGLSNIDKIEISINRMVAQSEIDRAEAHKQRTAMLASVQRMSRRVIHLADISEKHERHLKKVEEEQRRAAERIEEIDRKVDNHLRHKRKEPKKKDKDTHKRYVLNDLGRCPCCHNRITRLSDLECSHMESVSDSCIRSIWAICLPCNDLLQKADNRSEWRKLFEAYQYHFRRYYKAISPNTGARIKKPKLIKSPKGQRGMF